MMEPGAGGMGMMGQGGQGLMGGYYRAFQDSFNESLLISVGVASLAAVVVSILLSRGITSPLREMMTASQRIAEGNYTERVQVAGGDELAELGSRFNLMAEQLEQVESMRRRLIGDVAHELRTPLTAIKGSMEGLIDGILPATPETFEQIHQEAGRINRLVDDLQELSRVESGAYKLDLQPVEMSDMVRTVIKRLGGQFKDRGVSLDPRLISSSMTVLADAGRIEQVLTNLVGNALQYTSEGGTVSISASRANGYTQVTVHDTGIGIPPEHLTHIFDRFYRVDKSRSRAHGGSGIGLTIARHLVESHGGRIWAESGGEGQGSTFTFTLPLA
jgi:histidine kinase